MKNYKGRRSSPEPLKPATTPNMGQAIAAAGGSSATQPKPGAPTNPDYGNEDRKPAPQKPTAVPVKPTAPPTATKQPEPPAPAPTAQKEPKTLSQSISQKISRGESGGDSKDSYTQANIPVAPKNATKEDKAKIFKEAKIVKGNIDVTTGKPFEKSLNEMTIDEVINLSKRRYHYYRVPNPDKPGEFIYRGGSAMGKYQFVPGTLEFIAKRVYKDGEDYKSQLFDDQAQENLQAELLGFNSTRLKNAGIPASDAALYMMHFLGSPAQAAMVINGDENASMKPILDFDYEQKIKNGKKGGPRPSTENAPVAAMTIGQYRDYLRKKGFNFQDIDITKLNEPIKAPNIGAAIDAKSTQITAAKADAKSAQNNVTNNIAIQSQQNSKTQSNTKTEENDDPAYIKKSRQ
jgi:hypothetical protein